MNNLVERYVHQVGRYLPKKERAEIEAELRSMILDQLGDRYENDPTPEQVASVLKQLGEPRKMAASYGRTQYLVGPDLYPAMMMILRRGWVLVPTIVVLASALSAVLEGSDGTILGLFVQTLVTVLEAVFIFSGAIVLIFAVLQQADVELERKQREFDPLRLPDVNDPGTLDRVEIAFGMALGAFLVFLFSYFLAVGGLTLRFSLSDPGEVIPVPNNWLWVLILAMLLQLVLHLLVLRRNHWTVLTQGLLLVLELIGLVGLYYVLFLPLSERLLAAAPNPVDIPWLPSLPEMIAVSIAIFTTLTEGIKLLRLWNFRRSHRSPDLVQTHA